ncbi:MAG TPA: TRZ/ATZ family hydrolase [Usitatibacteraceae bacterium]|nr:TRZ/ATZ family hydrolase [Usitatibacteraceae bacterium]
MPQAIDSLIHAAWVAPVEPAGVLLAGHAVAVDGGRILALLPSEEARAAYAPRREWSLGEHLLIPGLVNAHGHAAMTLLRGLADDLPLMTWLQEHIWPAEGRHASDEFVHDGSLLACAEMLRAGITCFNDMYFFPEATARAALRAGMRASLGIIAIDFPSAYATDAASYLHKGLAVRDAYHGDELLTFCLAPHAPYTVGDEALGRIAVLAGELDIPVHTHLHETADEIAQGHASHGVRPLERLRRLGLVGPRLIAVHAVHLEGHEMDLLAREGASVVHCPASNLKLASGVAPVAALRARGVNVALGTDGAASNNRLDLLAEMRLAGLVAKGTGGDPSLLGADELLRMATLDGAKALGLDADIGSLLPGKRADIAAVELSSLETLPCYDPVSDLVYAAGREHVTHAWVGGEPRLEARRLTGLDEGELRTKAAWWRQRIRNPQ